MLSALSLLVLKKKKEAEEEKEKLFFGEMIDTIAKKLKELSESVSRAKELNETSDFFKKYFLALFLVQFYVLKGTF